MGLYKEQILSRIKHDRDSLDESFFRLASVVTGDTGRLDSFLSDREKAKNAIEEVLQYFHVLPVPVPDKINNIDDQLEFLLRPSGIMRRRVELTENWYKDGIGPLLAGTKEGKVIALLPGKFGGYSYFDHGSGRRITVTGKNAAQISVDAYCFYKPLPPGKLSVRDLLKYIVSSLAFSDLVMVTSAMLAVTLLGMFTP
jgi:hypothetical protein